MSAYQVLARKYRPKNFSELLGQEHIMRALVNAIDNQRLHHAYLFTGTRGVGKTTIARILAKCLNCQTKMSSEPCGICDICQAIDKGQFIDLIEIDAASRTKVEDTRELLENVPYAPVQGRMKVYLIDEVHMLSTHSFNALLKTLEEPPKHVQFLFATTDPQKLPITIVSRCLQFVLRPLPQKDLVLHLKNILTKEQIQYDESSLWQLAESAKGSVRDCLSLTDQAIAFGGGNIDEKTVLSMLGLIDSVDILSLLQDIYTDQRQNVCNHLINMRNQLVDAFGLLEKMIDVIHKITMIQIIETMPLNVSVDDQKKIHQLSTIIPSDTLQLYYEILTHGKETLKFSNTPIQGFEMLILRLLAFRPLSSQEMIVDENDGVIYHHDNIDYDVTQTSSQDQNTNTNNHSEEIIQPTIHTINYTNQLNTALDIVQDSNEDKHNEEEYTNNTPEPVYEPSKSEYETQEIFSQVNISQEDISIPLSESIIQNTNDIVQNHDEVATNIQQNNAVVLTNSYTKNTQNNTIGISELDLKNQLYPAHCVLQGVWTDEKWDYWVHYAYHHKILAEDEFAVAQEGVIQGDIQGQAVLHMQHVHYAIELSFGYLKEKIAQALGTILSITQTQIAPENTPKYRQQQRLLNTKMHAQQRLLDSSVLTQLIQEGFVQTDAPLTHLRLEF